MKSTKAKQINRLWSIKNHLINEQQGYFISHTAINHCKEVLGLRPWRSTGDLDLSPSLEGGGDRVRAEGGGDRVRALDMAVSRLLPRDCAVPRPRFLASLPIPAHNSIKRPTIHHKQDFESCDFCS